MNLATSKVTKRWFRRNKGNLIFTGLAIGSTVLSYPNIQENNRHMAMLRSQIAANNQKVESLEQNLEFEKAQAKIAETRYANGCIPVVYRLDPGKYVSLQEEKPVVDQVTKEPLPVGSVVCDSQGNTGTIIEFSDGTSGVSHMAFTGNRKIVTFRLKNYKGAKYSQPVN